jgi:hypothetical protein
MSISRHYLSEQIRRSKFDIRYENKVIQFISKINKEENDEMNADIINNQGHLYVLDLFQEYIENHNYNKRDLRKFLHKIRRKANIISKKIDDKYKGEISNDKLEQNPDDFKNLFFYYGVECATNDLLAIINGISYIDKSVYISTDLNKLSNNIKQSRKID